jgi:hypothetical protein
MTFPLPERGTFADILPLLVRHHAYQGGGCVGDVWLCRDAAGDVVAGWMWTPPAPGAARKYAPDCPSAVLSLSRMVAIPKAERSWQISKPLLWLMRHGLDRGRWPVLLTYSDAGAGHKGTAYQASRWKRGETTTAEVWEDSLGQRRTPRVRGGQRVKGLTRVGTTEITAWTHRVCPVGSERAHMEAAGWRYVEVPGRTWRSGAPMMTWERATADVQVPLFERGAA